MDEKLRIAQWGTGNVGRRALAAVIEHPIMELVALRVYAPAKEGKDAGSLCGSGPTGVLATRSIEDVIAARPDCVIYMPDHVDLDDLCRLLSAGINVATALVSFNHRPTVEPATLARIERACAEGNASLYATGSSPGWSTEMVPLTLLAMQRRLDSFTISDFADISQRDSPEMLALLGFGKHPSELDPNRKSGTAASMPATFGALAEAIGLPLTRTSTSIEYALANKREEVAAGVIEAGTVGAMRMGFIGWRGEVPLLQRYSLWYVTRDVDQPWEFRDGGWRMQVKGDTALDVSIAFDVAPADYADYSPRLTAHPVVNAVPYVCAARPGLVETRDLPIMAPMFVLD
jgi:4-hydroxy-tetrahydrodipicolinate reductase